MRISWFRATPADPANRLDDIAALIGTLRHTHEIEVVTESDAHAFVWRQFLEPSDLCVYELGDGDAYRFIWPYLFHYPGVLLLRQTQVHDSRAASLEQDEQTGDYVTEFRFNHGHPPRPVGRLLPRGGWPMLRAPLLASRMAVINDAELARTLQADYPDARLRHAPPGVGWESGPESGSEPEPEFRPELVPKSGPQPVRFALFGAGRADVAERAMRRAAHAGATATIIHGESPADALRLCDVVLALAWPAAGEPLTPALAGMAARKPVVVFEVEATACWPALDPQTWRPRGLGLDAAPIVVSIDPRDEEHSLMLVMRRLAADTGLRGALSSAGHAWWQAHATARHATETWLRLLDEAHLLAPPTPPADWPAHLNADGTSRARAILKEMGVSVDFLP
ncbi:MAG: hypothetical protein ABL993_03030 [Vicinamibacterales bacterium]